MWLCCAYFQLHKSSQKNYTCAKLPFHHSFNQTVWGVNNYDLWAEATWCSWRKKMGILFCSTGCGWQTSHLGSPFHYITLLQLHPSLLECSTVPIKKKKTKQAFTVPSVLHHCWAIPEKVTLMTFKKKKLQQFHHIIYYTFFFFFWQTCKKVKPELWICFHIILNNQH